MSKFTLKYKLCITNDGFKTKSSLYTTFFNKIASHVIWEERAYVSSNNRICFLTVACTSMEIAPMSLSYALIR